MVLQSKGAIRLCRIVGVLVAAGGLTSLVLPPLSLAKPVEGAIVAKTLETVSGEGCYAYGDNETPSQAKQAAQAIAQEKAVRSHRVFVQSATKVKNFQLEDNVIQTASAGMLEQIKVEKEEKKGGQEICVTISAKLSPISIEEMIQQRVSAKEINEEAAKSKVLSSAPGAGIRLWTNKADGRYVEGERLIVYVASDKDGYLKLDYFQADSTVVHLVPNLFNGQVKVKAGQTYVFGDDAAPPHFVIQGPFGNETITAKVSKDPFPIEMNSDSSVEDSRTFLNAQKTVTRGVKLIGAELSVTLVTESKQLSEYRGTRK